MSTSENGLKAIPLKPFGVRVTNIDVRNAHECNKLRGLLWENGVIILPAGAAREGAIDVHSDESLSLLGRLFGEPEAYHPVNKTIHDTDVQILETKGDSEVPAESLLFRSDMSWRVNPTLVSVLCGYEIPSSGGDTCFQSTHEMYKRLSKETKEELFHLSFEHSLDFGYTRVDRAHRDVKKDVKAIHPAFVKHPETGVPLLYVNENFTVGAVGMSNEKSDALMSKVLKEAYSEAGVLTHNWTQYDVVLWDNIGTQHMTKRDYEELRNMHRVVAGDSKLRLERFAGELQDVTEGLRNVEILLQSENNAEAYAKLATRYELVIQASGYNAPETGTDILAKHLKEHDLGSDPLILDVAAGTGRNALLLFQNYELTNIEAMDRCEEMLFEAKRKNLYKNYHISDANTQFPFESAMYDVSLCIGGLAPNQIRPSAIGEMVRITKPGGLVLVTMQERNDEYVSAAEGLIQEGKARLVEKRVFNGIEQLDNVTHACYVLQPC